MSECQVSRREILRAAGALFAGGMIPTAVRVFAKDQKGNVYFEMARAYVDAMLTYGLGYAGR